MLLMSLPSSSTVITVSAGLHWTDAKRKVPPTSYFLRGSPDSVHRQSAELPCCASVRRTYSFTVRAHLKYGQRSLWFCAECDPFGALQGFEGVRVETVMSEIDTLVSGRIAVPGNPTSS